MDIQKQLDVLNKRRDGLIKRFIEPLDKEINKLEKVKESFKSQIIIGYDTTEKIQQLDRLLNFDAKELNIFGNE